MKNNRNEPNNQVGEDTLVIGIDISKEHYYVGAVDLRDVPRKITNVDQGASIRNRLRKDIAIVKNQIQRWIDLYFPEFRQVFKHYGNRS